MPDLGSGMWRAHSSPTLNLAPAESAIRARRVNPLLYDVGNNLILYAQTRFMPIYLLINFILLYLPFYGIIFLVIYVNVLFKNRGYAYLVTHIC